MTSKLPIIPVLFLLATVCCVRKKEDKSIKTDSGRPAATVAGEAWITKADQTKLFQKENTIFSFDSINSNPLVITIDTSSAMQSIEGFGFSLTGGSAMLINGLAPEAKANLLQELFGITESSIGISYLRISIGASDLDAAVFSYDDLPAGQTDTSLSAFSLSKDTVHLIPLLKEILAINPSLKIMGSPWSPPVWMKDNNSSIGGSLLPKYYDVYAQYFVKYIQAMKAHGIAIDAITIQNEPQHGGNNPSMLMTANQQAEFIKNHLGPTFQKTAINTKIIVWDHNCDNPDYPISILNDAAARRYVHGAAFHLYTGDISALSRVHNAHSDKHLYFTEQWTGAKGSFNGDLMWHTKHVVIGSMRNWARVALEWNLAADALYNPHTPGGCTECKGALTISGASPVIRNVAYYIIAQAAKCVPPGSVRVVSTELSGLPNVAFLRPDGKMALLVLNESGNNVNFTIKFNGKYATQAIPAASVVTYVW